MEDFSSTLGQLRKSLKDFRKLFPFFSVVRSSCKSIWGHGGRFDGEEVSYPFSSGGGGVVQYKGVIKEKSPDFRPLHVVTLD